MIWVSKIRDLQYYHNTPGQYCYCDLILFPGDMTLQAPISQVTSASTCEIHAYSPDGLTDLGNYTSSFRWYTCTDGHGQYYWTAQLQYIYPLCAQQCFILRVVIKEGASVIWDKFTEQYCIQSCCVPVSSVTYEQVGWEKVNADADVFNNETGFGYVVNQCGRQVVAIIGSGTCRNASNGYFYGAGTKISGNSDAFRYQSISNIYASAHILPREIERTISRNCRTQEVERITKFRIQGQEEYPQWKMRDLEDQLSAETLYVGTDSIPELGSVILETTAPFTLSGRRNLDPKRERYKLDFEVRQCRQFQMFGCLETCPSVTDSTYAFIMPASEQYYTENGDYIGASVNDVQVYLRSLDMTTNAQIIYLSPPSSSYNIVIVSGTGYLPSSIYVGGNSYQNKVIAIPITDPNTDYGSLIPVVPCGSISIGVITSEEMICGSISIGTITSEEIGVTMHQIIQTDNWVIDSGNTQMQKLDYVVEFDLSVSNTDYPLGSTSPIVLPNISGEPIAVIPYPCRPSVAQNYDHNNYPSIPVGANIIINPNGYIYYSGSVTSADGSGSTITLTNILYNL